VDVWIDTLLIDKKLHDNKSKTQAGVFQALMTGWERVRQYQKEYNEGWMIGSAQREKQHSPYVQKCA